MIEDILELMVKRKQVKSKCKKYKTWHKEIRKKCDEAKEKWINDKCREIDLNHKISEHTVYRNIEEISEKKTCSST